MRQFVIASGLLLSVIGAAGAQALPYHIDPSARDIAPNLSIVPSIRFLTTADFPPFNYRDADGQLIGFNIDLARGLCNVLSVSCTVQAWPWEQAARALEDNQGDALIAGYERHFPLSGVERAQFTTLASGACIRFVLSRAWDWLNTPPDALVMRKDPLAYMRRLRHYDPALAARVAA